jgi:hypothetical protein
MTLHDLTRDLHTAALALEANGTEASDTDSTIVAAGLPDFIEGIRTAAPVLAHQCLGMKRPEHGEHELTDTVTSRVSVGRINGDLVVFARLRSPA